LLHVLSNTAVVTSAHVRGRLRESNSGCHEPLVLRLDGVEMVR